MKTPSTKHQIPNSKFQANHRLGIWNLVFGICDLEFTKMAYNKKIYLIVVKVILII